MPHAMQRIRIPPRFAARFSPGLLFGVLLCAAVPGMAETENHMEWICRAGSDGGWDCSEQAVPGAAFDRPKHRAAARSAKAPPKDEPRVKVARNLDWVDESALTAAQREKLASGCCGDYIEPARDYPDADLDPDTSSLRASADKTEAQGEVATLTGDVQVSRGYRQVRSDSAVVDQGQRTVTLQGNVQLREPGLLLLGNGARVNMDSNEVQIDDATYVFHESGIRGTAGQLRRGTDDIIYIDNATYTTCEPGNNTWLLSAGNVRIDPKTGLATARNMWVKAKDVPVLYLPWIRYPLDDRRASGLLFPLLSIGNENGLDIAQPIYLNLAPNYDATITPRYIQQRGPMMELETRHLSPYTETVVGGAYLWNDDGGDDSDEEINIDPVTGKRPHEGDTRWLVNIDHTGGIGYAWNTEIDYTKVSDAEYFRDLGNRTLEVSSQTHMKQLASAGYRTDNWRFNMMGVEYQTLIENTGEQYQQLPRLDADGRYYFNNLDLLLTLDNQYTMFDHNDSGRVTGNRLRMDYGLTWDKQWLWGYFKPSFIAKYLSYDLDRPVLPGGDDSPNALVPVATIDTGLYFERDTTLLKGHVQTFEPRLYYLNSDYEDQIDHPNFDTADLTFSYQQLFRNDRFAGSDRIGDTEQVTLGFTSRLIDLSTGLERVRASIGQAFYMDDRYVSADPTLSKDILSDSALLAAQLALLTNPGQRQLAAQTAAELLNNESDVAAELALVINPQWRFQSDMLMDPDTNKIDKGNLSLRYLNGNNAIFNMIYRYSRAIPRLLTDGTVVLDTIEQGDISTILPISDNWSLVGRWNHDITNSRELEVFGGFEYNSCCWRASVVARRWLDRNDILLAPQNDLQYDEGIFFQFQFKGLGGTGARVDDILSDGIYGYQPPQN